MSISTFNVEQILRIWYNEDISQLQKKRRRENEFQRNIF